MLSQSIYSHFYICPNCDFESKSHTYGAYRIVEKLHRKKCKNTGKTNGNETINSFIKWSEKTNICDNLIIEHHIDDDILISDTKNFTNKYSIFYT